MLWQSSAVAKAMVSLVPAEVSYGDLFCSSCVECRAFESGPFEKNCSQACSNIRVVQNVTGESRQCREKDSQNCWISFRMFQDDGNEIYTVTVDPEKGTPALLLLPLRLAASAGAAARHHLPAPQSAQSLPTSR